MDELSEIRAKFARQIEDSNKVQAFSTLDEWAWFVDTVLQPTIDEYTDRIMAGQLDERQEQHLKGVVQGLKLVINSTQAFVDNGVKAKQDAKDFEQKVKNDA